MLAITLAFAEWRHELERLMTELEIEELKRNLVENDSCKEEKRSPDDTGINLGRKVRERFLRSKAAGCDLILEVFLQYSFTMY